MNDESDKKENISVNDEQSKASEAPESHKFVSPGILLFVDQLLVAAAGWIYWLVISRFATTSEIGHATTIYSLVLLTTMIAQLGLEYPLLRRSQQERSKLLGTVLLIEMAITTASIPVVLIVVGSLYDETLQQFALMAVGIQVFTSLVFVFRFGLLGISDTKNVLIFDVIGNVVKFASGFLLVWAGFGALGILISFLLHAVLIAGGTFLIARRSFSFAFGSINFAKEIVRDALANTPAKLSRTFILSLSVILLAYFGLSSSDIGIFYIVVMISVAAGGLASSMAFMVIPASSSFKKDLSIDSMRLGLSFTTPVIVALVAAPKGILSIFGTEYVSAEPLLLVLAAGILPGVIVNNAISRYNNLGKSKQLIIIGIVQLVSFIVSFYLLVPQLGTLGAAYAMLVAFMTSGTLSAILSGRDTIRYILVSIFSIAIGSAVGYGMANFLGWHPAIVMVVSIAVSIAVILVFKNTSIKEVKQLASALR
jgi:O-antigen/teichoic acid export membrane protein